MTNTVTLQKLRYHVKNYADQTGLTIQCEPDGTVFADTAIIGDVPGEREVAQKVPFVGSSGTQLWNALQKHTGTRRNQYYMSHVIKRHVSVAKVKGQARDPINRNEFDHWRSLLMWELQQLPHLRYIIAVGSYALEAFTRESSLGSWRGSVLDVSIGPRTVKVLFVNSMADLRKNPKLEIIFNLDINKYKRLVEGKLKPYDVETEVYAPVERVLSVLDDMDKAGDPISLDIEVINNETACIGFANTKDYALCVALRDSKHNVYTTKEEVAIRRRIQELVAKPEQRIVAQNGMFDLTWLWFKDRIRISHIWFDTMLAHHTLYSQLPHNLGFLTTQYTDNPYYKDEKNNWREGGDIMQFWRYNGKDCGYTLDIANKLLSELRAQKMDKFFFDHVMRLSPHLAKMTVGGIKLDMDMKTTLHDTLLDHTNTLLLNFQRKVQEVTGDPDLHVNPKSPKQLTDLYFNRLGLVGRGTSTDDENRDRMMRHPRTPDGAREILHLHNEFIKEQKFFSTYVKTAVDEDGRMRCTYNQTGTQSSPGRLSSSSTLWGSGTNLQNQPERAHPMFTADDNYVFGYFDMAQAEARCVGWEAKITKWMHQFEQARLDGKFDAHRALASDMFKIPYDEVPTFDRYDTAKGYIPPEGKVDGDVTVRFIAKRCRHGLNYRMAADRLATTTGLSIREAEIAYRLYHNETPELRKWWELLEDEVKRTRYLFNPFGRRLTILERLSPDALESIVAFKPQSTIGDKVCRVIYQAHDHPKWPKRARIVLNIHDALICIAHKDDVELALSIMKAYAEEPLYIHGERLIIPADTKMSYPDENGIHRWSNLKGYDVQAYNLNA